MTRGEVRPISKLLSEAVDRIDQLFRSQSSITGVSTGFMDLDEKTSGLQPSDLIIIAGRPSMGKTSLAMNIAENAAVGHKVPVAVFSMEMPGTQLAMRMMSSLGRINAHREVFFPHGDFTRGCPRRVSEELSYHHNTERLIRRQEENQPS